MYQKFMNNINVISVRFVQLNLLEEMTVIATLETFIQKSANLMNALIVRKNFLQKQY